MTRRRFVAAALAAPPRAGWPERLGVMCQLGRTEKTARETLAAARNAGFRRVQVNFAWDRVDAAFLRALPGWIQGEDLRCEVLSAYVNCLLPAVSLMATREQDFARAIAFAGEIGAHTLVAWTGSYGRDLMRTDQRNHFPEAAEHIRAFILGHRRALEAARLSLALETYVTLACPGAPALRTLLNRLPRWAGAVLDPPNLTPPARFAERDQVLDEMFVTLRGRIRVVHLKDFRLRPDGGYDLPGPLAGALNYPRLVAHLRALPAGIPVIAEHIGPADFAATRRALLRLFDAA